MRQNNRGYVRGTTALALLAALGVSGCQVEVAVDGETLEGETVDGDGTVTVTGTEDTTTSDGTESGTSGDDTTTSDSGGTDSSTSDSTSSDSTTSDSTTDDSTASTDDSTSTADGSTTDDSTSSSTDDATTADAVAVTFHGQPGIGAAEDRWVAFAVPFPQGARQETADLALQVGGAETPVMAEVVANWPDGSVRSVRLWTQVAIGAGETVSGELVTGATDPARLDSVGVSVADTWIPISESGVDESEYTTAEVMEPAVYTTLPAEWLAGMTLRTETVPVDAWSDSGWFDEALLGYSRTMVNDVSDAVSEEDLVNYEPDTWGDTGSVDTSSWLFDRASTLWGVYFRTGDVKWLRHAHRASQYYALNVERDNDTSPSDSDNRNFRGQFRFKDINYVDHKYSYGMPMLMDRLVLGAAVDGPAAGEDGVRAVSDLVTNGYWEGTYGSDGAYNPDLGANHLWTERHQAYAFAAHLTAWEYTGDAAYRDKLDDYVAQMVDHVANPPGGYAADGCLVHDFKHHEWNKYNDTPTPVCSPWMTALLAEPLWRYHRLTGDDRALGLLADFAESVAQDGTYIAQDESSNVGTSSTLWDARLPQYLYSSSYNGVSEGVSDPWQDWEHACDVAGLVERGVTAGEMLDRDMAAEQTVADDLMATCETNLDKWYRPGDDSYVSQYGPEWRLTPARKYNWWFGTTLDLPRLR
ncbi:RIFT barrel domain-containing protein [Thiohalospira halophila]|nr:hypothetical protein [Thiohalospira halophila]